MAARALARGMGTFFKTCEHPESRWSKCPHPYKIRYRNAAGKQSEESGFATPANAFDKMRAILLDAHRLGIFSENPVEGVKPPQYDPARAVIPSLVQLQEIRTAGDDAFTLIVDVMSGYGLRNGEAAAVNVNNIVADDVYRASEHVVMSAESAVHSSTASPGSTRGVPRRADALARSSGRTVTEVARELGVSPEGLRNWVKQDKTDRGSGARSCSSPFLSGSY